MQPERAAATSPVECRDVVSVGPELWLLTTTGHLYAFSVKGQPLALPVGDSLLFDAIVSSANGVLGATGLRILRWDASHTCWQLAGKLPEPARFLLTSPTGDIWAITNRLIVEVNSNYTYAPTRWPNAHLRHPEGLRTSLPSDPTAALFDSVGNLWIGYNHGEWGGNSFCFDTHQRTFVTLSEKTHPFATESITGFCSVGQATYALTGLTHMGFCAGKISRITATTELPLFTADGECGEQFIDDQGHLHPPESSDEQPAAVGAGIFKAADSCLYFAASGDLYKAHIRTELANRAKWHKLQSAAQLANIELFSDESLGLYVRKLIFAANGQLVVLTSDKKVRLLFGFSLSRPF